MKEVEAIRLMIAKNEAKLDETVAGLDRGPVKDAIRLVVPMLQDQHRIMDSILELIEKRK